MIKEIKVGLFAVLAGSILYFGILFLKGNDLFSNSNKYYVLYSYIDGLNVSNPVVINGFTVGKVSNIQLVQDKNNEILVELDVKDDVVLGVNTVATLANSDFLGSKAILLDLGEPKGLLVSGDTIPASIDKGLGALLESAQPITTNLNLTIQRINEILLGMKGSGEKINHAIDNMNTTLVSINSLVENNQRGIKSAIDNLNTTLVTYKNRGDDIKPILDNTNLLMASLNKLQLDSTVNSLNTGINHLNQMIVNINNGKGSLGKIMTDDSLYINLNSALIDFDKLVIHLNEDPKHFLGPLGKSRKKIERERLKEKENNK